jgi:sec-independent protein translocase protein TatC
VPPKGSTATSPEREVSEPSYDREMTILEHLAELRNRLMIASIGLVVGMAISAVWLTTPAMQFLTLPAQGVPLVVLRPAEAFTTYMKVAFALGAALSMPVIVHQLLLFVMPALHPHERKWVYIGTPAVTLAFMIGLVFALLVVVPAALNFLAGFNPSGVVTQTWDLDEYLSFVSSFVFWIGVSFETPIIVFLLAKLQVVNVRQLSRYRRYALVGAFVLGAIITPTPDPFNQLIVSIPLYLLYELGVLFARFA